MHKKWEIDLSLDPQEKQTVNHLAAEFKCPFIIAELLYKKSITDREKLDNFLNPCISSLHDPFLFKDMHKAINRIVRALDSGEKITIYGDYDVDGTTATALLYLGLKDIGATVDYYIPHRMIDGYGLSINCLKHLQKNGTTFIITVDCGTIAIEEILAINKMGIDIIITDHHNSKTMLPTAYAVINPKIENDSYPYKDLAGVGVAYKLLMGIYQYLGKQSKENTLKYLDLVALGTIADIVPLTEENRVFSTIGLAHLNQRKNVGLKALMKFAGFEHKETDSNDIIYGIAPRINAAGRMNSAMRAVELLVSDEKSKSEELAELIEKDNSARQQIDQKTFDEACDVINKKYKNMEDTFCIVISSDHWHPGVIGIVASKLNEKYYRPTIMIAHHEGVGSGSGRGIANFDLFKAIENCEDLLVTFGGHKYAVGLTILPEYIDAFENKLSEYIKNTIDIKVLKPPLRINKKIELYEISYKLMEWLGKFAPFGVGNLTPVFYTEQVIVKGYPYNVGKNHLKMKVVKDGCELDLIGFHHGDFLPLLKSNSRLNIAYTLEVVTWMGTASIQGNLKDIQLI